MGTGCRIVRGACTTSVKVKHAFKDEVFPQGAHHAVKAMYLAFQPLNRHL